ncbi:fumarylacetoacetate hydrolase family protein [Phaeobacter sp. 22II1-1F12B]|uniref:fumarylacetoacetate hydrolase family protein n=1 Tax=Phaeobacter sp. 22II1-1F12B TaxID=1317111 RepID=UPI000B521086|nr:fumarylacetoacetate hydrolase family protein [Phaeobacter sp. 22II1-1F12B]OWU82732.1 fumarylacetoacetase [Phaeobacter sp. 22II1-1F12B]
MSELLFDLPKPVTIPVNGETAEYPIGRIFCVGRNYAAHAAEMGFEVDREAPFYFTKSPANAVLTGATMPYPPGTKNFHYEMELVMAIGAPVFRASKEEAEAAIYAFGCGLDMTRRDLQIASREKQRPWDLGKDVEDSAVFSPLTKAGDLSEMDGKRIHLEVNGEVKQDATLAELIWKLDEIIMDLSKFYHLRPGDVIMTGTPAGVGPVVAGDKITGGIDGLDPISLTLSDAE